MENAHACPIESHLSRILAVQKPQSEILNALFLLEKIVFNLITFPSEEKYKHLKKTCPLFNTDFLGLDGVQGFLLFIGFKEEGGSYNHRTSDENMKILEEASKRLNYYINQLKLEEPSQPLEIKKKETAINGKTESKGKGFFGRFCNKNTEPAPCKIKSFLDKHFKKGESDLSTKYQNVALNGSPGYSFNSEGYFHQSCADRQSSRKKDPRLDIFHNPEPVMKKEKCTLFSFCKKK